MLATSAEVREQFETEWRQILVHFRWCLDNLHREEVEEIKVLARTAYTQGRTDEAFHQMRQMTRGMK